MLDTSVKAVINYAVNGAYYYAKHIARNSTFKKVFALGVSGDAKHHRITPLYVDDRDGYMMLDDLDTFVSFPRRTFANTTRATCSERPPTWRRPRSRS